MKRTCGFGRMGGILAREGAISTRGRGCLFRKGQYLFRKGGYHFGMGGYHFCKAWRCYFGGTRRDTLAREVPFWQRVVRFGWSGVLF